MSQLLDYITLLDTDAPAREAHNQNPQASMTQYGLTSEEQQALMSWDKAAIARLTGVGEDDFPVPQAVNTNDTY